MGNKKKLINKGLIDKFPDNIGVFVDVFAGSSIVGMNVNADKHIVNDSDSNLVKLYELFKEYPPKRVYVFVNRVNCGKNGVFGKESSAVCYCWFVWEKGFKGKPTIDWIE